MTTITEPVATTPLELIGLLGQMLKGRPAYPTQAREIENLRKVYVLCRAEDPRWVEFLKLWGSQVASPAAARSILIILEQAAKLGEAPEPTVREVMTDRELRTALAPKKEAAKKAAPAPAPADEPEDEPEMTEEQLRRARIMKISEDGMYRVPQTGEIFKVQRNKAQGDGNRLYAKQLVMTVGKLDDASRVWELREIPLQGNPALYVWDAQFKYIPGAVLQLLPSDRMTLDEAKAFGALYGTCCRCGRTLTDEASIAAGIGPKCAGKI